MEVLAGARYRQGLLQGRLEAMEPGSRTEAEVGAVTRNSTRTGWSPCCWTQRPATGRN